MSLDKALENFSRAYRKHAEDNNKPISRDFMSYRFFEGDKEEIKAAFIFWMKEVDSSIKKVKWLPEYDEIIDWIADTDGKHLCLTGAKGVGKTNIIMYILPRFFYTIKREVATMYAYDITKENYMNLKTKFLLAIDEVGQEKLINDWGSYSEALIDIFNHFENSNGVLMITTNLTRDEIESRYGSRVDDRLKRFKIIDFKSESLR